MKNKIPTLRSPLARVRSLGSARHGTQHWWMQRLTALALIPLTIYLFTTFFLYVVYGGYDGALIWLRSPISAMAVLLFIMVGFHHAASGLQVVIEDYVHCEATKLASLILVKFAAVALALLGIVATVKVLFGV